MLLHEENNKNSDYPAYISTKDPLLEQLYGTACGRVLLKPMCTKGFSDLVGNFLDTPLSTQLIPGFIKKYSISLHDYQRTEYRSFNDFFTRKIKAGARPIDKSPFNLIAPCDSKVSAYEITPDSVFMIKGVPYSVSSLLHSQKLADHYAGGHCFIFRLSVDDYHRYCFPDDGIRTRYIRIPGVYHTVNPMILKHHNIYRENTREYTVLMTRNFGRIVMMQVGAMLVGRICNNGPRKFRRGDEAGYFEYGGSTVVLLTEAGCVSPNAKILERSLSGIETVVKMGDKVARAKQ